MSSLNSFVEAQMGSYHLIHMKGGSVPFVLVVC